MTDPQATPCCARRSRMNPELEALLKDQASAQAPTFTLEETRQMLASLSPEELGKAVEDQKSELTCKVSSVVPYWLVYENSPQASHKGNGFALTH